MSYELGVKYSVEFIDEFKHVWILKTLFMEKVSVPDEWQLPGVSRAAGIKASVLYATGWLLSIVRATHGPAQICNCYPYIQSLTSSCAWKLTD